MMIKKIVAPLALVGTLALSATALAHGSATGVVKERMELMKSYKAEMKVLVPMLKGQADFDLKAFQKAGAHFHKTGANHLLKGFPQGSLHEPSEASPAIWKNWDKFEGFSKNMTEAAAVLSQAADEGSAKAAFGTVAKACKQCHEDFRIEKD